MTEFPSPAFPLVVTATSDRRGAIVIMDRPLRLQARIVVTPDAVAETTDQAVMLFQPATLVHANGTRWQLAEPPSTSKRALATTVSAACEFLGIKPNRFAVIERLLDSYSDLESRLGPVLLSRRRDDRVRAVQPLLAALIVAHAASVAHLMKYG